MDYKNHPHAYQYTTWEEREQILEEQLALGKILVEEASIYADESATDKTHYLVFEVPDIPALIARQQEQINASCEAAITAGIDYSGEHYALTIPDQLNILALADAAKSGESVPYHADGELCRIYAPADMLGLAQAATQHKVYHTTYCNLLKRYVATLTDAASIMSVQYGIDLPSEYAAIMAQILGGEGDA